MGSAAPAYTFVDPGFSLQSLRENAVLRCEYRPGSALYVVWQPRRQTRGLTDGFTCTRGVRDLWDVSGDRVLMVKASFWLGL